VTSEPKAARGLARAAPWLDQTRCYSHGYGVHSVARSEFSRGNAQVVLSDAFADTERQGYFICRLSVREMCQSLEFDRFQRSH
jgi:hypothetical protein